MLARADREPWNQSPPPTWLDRLTEVASEATCWQSTFATRRFIEDWTPGTRVAVLRVVIAAERVQWLRDNVRWGALCPDEDRGDPGGHDRLRDALKTLMVQAAEP